MRLLKEIENIKDDNAFGRTRNDNNHGRGINGVSIGIPDEYRLMVVLNA